MRSLFVPQGVSPIHGTRRVRSEFGFVNSYFCASPSKGDPGWTPKEKGWRWGMRPDTPRLRVGKARNCVVASASWLARELLKPGAKSAMNISLLIERSADPPIYRR
jgi:hypothetical protein